MAVKCKTVCKMLIFYIKINSETSYFKTEESTGRLKSSSSSEDRPRRDALALKKEICQLGEKSNKKIHKSKNVITKNLTITIVILAIVLVTARHLTLGLSLRFAPRGTRGAVPLALPLPTPLAILAILPSSDQIS